MRLSTLCGLHRDTEQQRKKNSCIVEYNGKHFFGHPEIVLHCISQQKKTSSVVSHNGGKPSLLYPTTEKTLPLYPTTEKKPLLLYPTLAKNRNTEMTSQK
jgi:hypothetical protein